MKVAVETPPPAPPRNGEGSLYSGLETPPPGPPGDGEGSLYRSAVDPPGSLVLGVGIDLCELDRIHALLERLGDQFLRRAYNPAEIDYICEGSGRARRCAGLFAAKEAVVKCLGTGFASGVGWKQVEVVPAGAHRPVHAWNVTLHGEAARRCEEAGNTRWKVDVQFSRDHAAAIAVWARQVGTERL